MSPRPEVRNLAGAMRRAARREHARRGPGRYEGVVQRVSPLLVDVLGIDADLDDDDITIGDALAAYLVTTPLAVNDVLVLVETEEGDYDAVDVLR